MLTPSRMRAAATVISLVVVVVLVASHVRLAIGGARQPSELIQASAAAVTGEVLAERQPILLTDELAVADHGSLRATLFRWLHCGPLSVSGSGRVGASTARFTLLSCFSQDKCDVSISPTSGHDGHQAVTVNLMMSRGRTLVLPPGWAWTSSSAVTVSELHDPVTWTVARIRGLGSKRPT